MNAIGCHRDDMRLAFRNRLWHALFLRKNKRRKASPVDTSGIEPSGPRMELQALNRVVSENDVGRSNIAFGPQRSIATIGSFAVRIE